MNYIKKKSFWMILQSALSLMIQYAFDAECLLNCQENKSPTFLLFSSVQLLSRVRLSATSWTVAGQASLSITNSQSLLKLMSVKLAMPSNHLILCCPLLLLPSTFYCKYNYRVFHLRQLLEMSAMSDAGLLSQGERNNATNQSTIEDSK